MQGSDTTYYYKIFFEIQNCFLEVLFVWILYVYYSMLECNYYLKEKLIQS